MEVVINKNLFTKISGLGLVLVGGLLVSFVVILRLVSNVNQPQPIAMSDCVPAFLDGGGPYYVANSPFRENIAPAENDGEKLVVEGYLYNSDCSHTVANAVIDIWQANESGDYEDEYYRGQITTDRSGYYRFETVVPLGYGEGTAYRPPHIHFKVFYDNQELVTSQMFFDDVRGQTGFNDAYIIEVNRVNNVLNGDYNIVLP